MRKLFDLFFTFAKIGTFTFGGGYAMISLIENNCVERKKWITNEDMMNMTVIAESTPGPIAINAATFVGYKQAGLLGAVAATLGVTLPSFIIILLISLFFNNFLEITIVANAFKGIKIAVGLLILNAGINMIGKMQKKVFPCIIMICSFAMMMCINIFAWNFSTIVLLLIAAVISFVYYTVKEKTDTKGGDGK